MTPNFSASRSCALSMASSGVCGIRHPLGQFGWPLLGLDGTHVGRPLQWCPPGPPSRVGQILGGQRGPHPVGAYLQPVSPGTCTHPWGVLDYHAAQCSDWTKMSQVGTLYSMVLKVKGQASLPMPAMASVPGLPEVFRGATGAVYARHRPRTRRDLCSICVWTLHHAGGTWAPRVGVWSRRGPDADLEGFAYLCPQHRREWLERDQKTTRDTPPAAVGTHPGTSSDRGRVSGQNRGLGEDQQMDGLPSATGEEFPWPVGHPSPRRSRISRPRHG